MPPINKDNGKNKTLTIEIKISETFANLLLKIRYNKDKIINKETPEMIGWETIKTANPIKYSIIINFYMLLFIAVNLRLTHYLVLKIISYYIVKPLSIFIDELFFVLFLSEFELTCKNLNKKTAFGRSSNINYLKSSSEFLPFNIFFIK